MVKNPLASAGDSRDTGLIPGLGRFPGEGNGNLLQYCCWKNPMDRGAWWATVHGGHTKLDMTEKLSNWAHRTLTLRSWGRQISPDIAKFSGYKIAPYWESQIYESLYKCMSLLGLPNKVPQLGDLLDVYYLIALEATSVRSTCGQGWFLLEAGRGYVPGLSCSFW